MQRRPVPACGCLCWVLLGCWVLSPLRASLSWGSRPNVVVLLADDLGVGDLSCYGNLSLSTPSTERLSREGVLLTQHLAVASVCTPSRAALLTGRYPMRSGMAPSSELEPALPWLAASGGLPANETTFARLLRDQGYRTGLVGKWDLGLSCTTRDDHCHHPLNHGFEYYFGPPMGLLDDCQPSQTPELHRPLRIKLWASTAVLALVPLLLAIPNLVGWFPMPWMVIVLSGLLVLAFFTAWYSMYGFVRHWNCILMRDHEIVQQPLDEERVSTLMLKEAMEFLNRYKRAPFLLVVSFLHVRTPLITRDRFVGRSRFGRYGDSVEELDWMVGKILDTLDREQLTNRTLVYFTSDNGGRLGVSLGGVALGGWNSIYRGGGGSGGWEGGIRVPGILRWPGVLPPGLVVDTPTSHLDLLPTLCHAAGALMPADRVIDGKDLLPLLEDRALGSGHEFLFHYSGDRLQAVRWHQRHCHTVWKAHLFTPGPPPATHDPPLLFDLTRDPGEQRPLETETTEREMETPGPEGGSLGWALAGALEQHRRGLSPAPWQLRGLNLLWKPWLQPCCSGGAGPCTCDRL